MPLYEYQCPSCDQIMESLQKPDVATIPCPTCPDWYAERIISLPTVRPDLVPYYDDGLGARVESRAHRRQLMQQASLVENDAPVRPHGARGTVFSFPGQATTSVPPNGAFAQKRG